MVSLYFRGHRVLQTTLKDLFLHRRLGEATEVLLAGHSAGAMAVLIHADAIRARFAASTRYWCCCLGIASRHGALCFG